jgi:hypothetical protein
MDELTRFARRLVEQLGAGTGGVHRAVAVAAIREKLLPYRTHRRALALDSVEDYETVLLRLVAEERGYVKTTPAAAAKRCREEIGQPTPDLGVLDEISDATIQITSLAAARIVADEGGEAGTPSPPSPPPSPPEPTMPPEPTTPHQEAPTHAENCRHCRKPVPGGRQVVFCPWCGLRLIPFACARCGTELDSEWRHCITCGAPVKDPYRFV